MSETQHPHPKAAASPKVTLRRGASAAPRPALATQPPDLPHGMSADQSKWTADDYQRFDEHQRRKQLAGLGTASVQPEPAGDVEMIAGFLVRTIDPETGRREITDALGRKLVVQDLDPVEELDLYEACGNNSMNAPYVGTALMAASLRSITSAAGVQARAFPRNAQHIRAALQALGRPGMTALRAVRAAATPSADEASGEAEGSRELAKN